MIEKVSAYSLAEFENIYDKYAGAFYHIILLVVKDAEAAGEILENTFCYVFINLHQYDSSKCILFIWINNIVKSHIVIYAQKVKQKY